MKQENKNLRNINHFDYYEIQITYKNKENLKKNINPGGLPGSCQELQELPELPRDPSILQEMKKPYEFH